MSSEQAVAYASTLPEGDRVQAIMSMGMTDEAKSDAMAQVELKVQQENEADRRAAAVQRCLGFGPSSREDSTASFGSGAGSSRTLLTEELARSAHSRRTTDEKMYGAFHLETSAEAEARLSQANQKRATVRRQRASTEALGQLPTTMIMTDIVGMTAIEREAALAAASAAIAVYEDSPNHDSLADTAGEAAAIEARPGQSPTSISLATGVAVGRYGTPEEAGYTAAKTARELGADHMQAVGVAGEAAGASVVAHGGSPDQVRQEAFAAATAAAATDAEAEVIVGRALANTTLVMATLLIQSVIRANAVRKETHAVHGEMRNRGHERMTECSMKFLRDGYWGMDALERLQVLSVHGHVGAILYKVHTFTARPFFRFAVMAALVILIIVEMSHTGAQGKTKPDGLCSGGCWWHDYAEYPASIFLFLDVLMMFMYEVLPFREINGAISGTRMRRYTIFFVWVACICDVLYVDYLGNVLNGWHSLRVYLYLVLLILHSETLWASVNNFAAAMWKAQDVIAFFIVALLVTSSQSLALLRGSYSSGDFYVDNQYSDFFNSFTTMFIYLSTGENYVEAVGLALELPGGTYVYFLYFLSCSLLGTFFISSLLIDMFQSNFLEKDDGEMTKMRRLRWNSIVVTYETWRRHSQGAWEGSPPRFDYPMFLDLMFQMQRGNRDLTGTQAPAQFRWLAKLRFRVNRIAIKLLDHPKHMTTELRGLSLMCADLHFTDLYDKLREKLVTAGVYLPETAMACRLWQQDRGIGTHTRFDECEKIRHKLRKHAGLHRESQNRESVNEEEEDLIDVFGGATETPGGGDNLGDLVPPWIDLEGCRDSSNKDTQEVVVCAQLMTLHKWRLYTLFQFVKGVDATDNCEAQFPTGLAPGRFTLRQFQPEGVQTGEIQTRRSQQEQYSETQGMFDRSVLQAAGVRLCPVSEQAGARGPWGESSRRWHLSVSCPRCCVVSERGAKYRIVRQSFSHTRPILFSPDELSEGVIDWPMLAQGQHIVAPKCGWCFKSLDVHYANENPPASIFDFHRLMYLADLSFKLTESEALRLDALLMQIDLDIGDVKVAMQHGADSVEIERVHQEASTKEEMLALKVTLEEEHEATDLQIQAASTDRTRVIRELWGWVLYIVAWLNVMTCSFYATGIPIDALDLILAFFPVLQFAHTAYEIYTVGTFNRYCESAAEPARRLARLLTVFILTVSFVGLFFHHFAYGVLPKNLSRTMLAATCWFVFIRSVTFGRMLHTMSLSFWSCTPYLLTMFIIMMIASIAARDLYHDKAYEEDGSALFPDFTRSFITMFRLFIGEGWHGVMYAAAYNTNAASKYFFMMYTFLVTMLFGQLLLGVIISQYQNVEEVISTRVFLVVQQVAEGGSSSSAEREQVMDEFLSINYKMFGIHTEIDRISNPTELPRDGEGNLYFPSNYLALQRRQQEEHGLHQLETKTPQLIAKWIQEEIRPLLEHSSHTLRHSVRVLMRAAFSFGEHMHFLPKHVYQELFNLRQQLTQIHHDRRAKFRGRVRQIEYSPTLSRPEGRAAEELLPAFKNLPEAVVEMVSLAEQAVFRVFATMELDRSKAHTEFLTPEVRHARNDVVNNAEKLKRVVAYSFASRRDMFEYPIIMEGFHKVLFDAMWTAYALPRFKREILSVFQEQMQLRMERLGVAGVRQSLQGVHSLVAMFSEAQPSEGQEDHLDEDQVDHNEFHGEFMRQIDGPLKAMDPGLEGPELERESEYMKEEPGATDPGDGGDDHDDEIAFE